MTFLSSPQSFANFNQVVFVALNLLFLYPSDKSVQVNSLYLEFGSMCTKKSTEPRIEPCGIPPVILVDNIGPPLCILSVFLVRYG